MAVRLSRVPRIITFDCYGTLIDWDSGIRNVFQAILESKAAKVSLNEFHKRWNEIEFELIQGPFRPYREILKASVERTIQAFGLPVSPNDGSSLAESMVTWQPFPDVKPSLEKLRERYKIAIISNTENAIIERSIANMNVHFDYVTTAEEAKAYKPSHKIFRLALDRMGATTGDMLHAAFGFNYDIIPAKALGISTVWVNRKKELFPRYTHPEHVVQNLHQLVELAT